MSLILTELVLVTIEAVQQRLPLLDLLEALDGTQDQTTFFEVASGLLESILAETGNTFTRLGPHLQLFEVVCSLRVATGREEAGGG